MIRPVATLLTLAAFAASASAADKPAAKPRRYDPDAVRCVKLPVTGSLARYERTCMTNREWEQNRDEARRMQSVACVDRSRCTGS